MHATLTVPVAGTREERIQLERASDEVLLPLRPKRFRLTRNDHNKADECEVTVDWREAGVDPRLLDDGVLTVYADNADDRGEWEPSEANCRFIGLVNEIEANRDANYPGEVRLSCVDFTSCFIRAKPFGSAGIPSYAMRLDEAWRTVVSQTPGAEKLADRLVLVGLDSYPLLGAAVADRFATIGKVPTKPETDAWAVWQQCVGMMGLISYIYRDQCIVTTATNYYSDQDAPVFLYGKNLESLNESRIPDLAKKGVGLTSFDPITQTAIEAFWPPIGDERVKRKRARSKKIQTTDQLRQSETRDFFAFPGVTNEEALERVAQRVWEERSRQELVGRAVTRELFVTTEHGLAFDTMFLGAGDSIRVEVEPENKQLLASLPSFSERVAFLRRRGYSPQVAELIVKNMQNFAQLSSKFLVRTSETELEVNEDGGSFSVSVEYCNRIEIDGSATA